MIDADEHPLSERLQHLDDTLDADGQERRRPDERIAVFVPKRHIESWIRFASGEPVDETTDFHDFERREGACKPHVLRLANEMCQRRFPDDAPPSLHVACDEIARIF